MTAPHDVRSPAPGQRLRVHVRGHDGLVRDALSRTLASAGCDVVPLSDRAHVVLLDLGPSGAAAPQIPSGAPVVVLSDTERDARRALAAGARGAISRDAEPTRVGAALAAAAAGLVVMDFVLAPPPRIDAGISPTLTPREREVLELMAAGLSNRRIAKRLGISEHTAKFHVNGVLDKLGARTRTEAVVTGAKVGLLAL